MSIASADFRLRLTGVDISMLEGEMRGCQEFENQRERVLYGMMVDDESDPYSTVSVDIFLSNTEEIDVLLPRCRKARPAHLELVCGIENQSVSAWAVLGTNRTCESVATICQKRDAKSPIANLLDEVREKLTQIEGAAIQP